MLAFALFLAFASPGTADVRVGSATARVALLPVQCERDLDPALGAVLGEAVAVQLAGDPRLDVITPKDIDVLLGAETVADLAACEGAACYQRADFRRIDAGYLLALSAARLGDEARLVVRLVDLQRGVVIDRDEADAPMGDERAIEQAARRLALGVLVRRGLAQPTLAQSLVAEDARATSGPNGLVWAGIAASTIGVLTLGGGGYLGLEAVTRTQALRADAATLTKDELETRAADPRAYAGGADLLLAAGGALVVTGGLMILGGAL